MEIASPSMGAAFGGAPSAAAKAGATLDSDFETFLKMLTAQMKNQDPMNPVDSTEFASQLAAFSTVEQQVLTNDLLTDLGRQMGVLGMAQLQGWVGMTARAEMPVSFDGSPVELVTQTQPGTDLARLVVRDARGGIVQETDVPPAGGTFLWSGRDDAGALLPDGVYSITVDSFQGQDMLGSAPVQSHARIVEARMAKGNTILVMDGGQQVNAADVLGLRDPEGA